jgi:hypothetical protein
MYILQYQITQKYQPTAITPTFRKSLYALNNIALICFADKSCEDDDGFHFSDPSSLLRFEEVGRSGPVDPSRYQFIVKIEIIVINNATP